MIFSLSLSLFALSVMREQSHILSYLYMAPFGYSLVSIMPACLGLGIELTFPKLQPAIVNGMMLFFA